MGTAQMVTITSLDLVTIDLTLKSSRTNLNLIYGSQKGLKT